MDRSEIRKWLTTDDPTELATLWRMADEARRRCVGDAVYLRGLVEFSNQCDRKCTYCGVRAGADVPRYRMTGQAIVDCARRAAASDCGTVVLQSGEDPDLTAEWLADIIHRIKSETGQAVTLSVGERSDDELALWRQAGADRYLLRFETSDPVLYQRVHPPRPQESRNRFDVLASLRRMDYEVGSGVMVGLPGQTFDTLANDLAMFAELDLDMIGVGPYVEHPATPMGADREAFAAPAGHQVPADQETALKVVALTRLVCPDTNIPATTALATLDFAAGYEAALGRGANVIMVNMTPTDFRRLYEIYPAKACMRETADFHVKLKRRITSVGRTVGAGRGDSPRRETRIAARSEA